MLPEVRPSISLQPKVFNGSTVDYAKTTETLEADYFQITKLPKKHEDEEKKSYFIVAHFQNQVQEEWEKSRTNCSCTDHDVIILPCFLL